MDRKSNLRSFLAKFSPSPPVQPCIVDTTSSTSSSCYAGSSSSSSSSGKTQEKVSLNLASAPLIDLCDSASESDTPTPTHTHRSRDPVNELPTVKRARTELSEAATAVVVGRSSKELPEPDQSTAVPLKDSSVQQSAIQTDAWSCQYCTYLHTGEGCSRYLQCDLCGSLRHTVAV